MPYVARDYFCDTIDDIMQFNSTMEPTNVCEFYMASSDGLIIVSTNYNLMQNSTYLQNVFVLLCKNFNYRMPCAACPCLDAVTVINGCILPLHERYHDKSLCHFHKSRTQLLLCTFALAAFSSLLRSKCINLHTNWSFRRKLVMFIKMYTLKPKTTERKDWNEQTPLNYRR